MNKEIMKFWKTQWEAYLKSMFAMQEQGEKMLELMFSQSGVLQEESKKMMKEWTLKSKKNAEDLPRHDGSEFQEDGGNV